jgi:hypothetical protein
VGAVRHAITQYDGVADIVIGSTVTEKITSFHGPFFNKIAVADKALLQQTYNIAKQSQ